MVDFLPLIKGKPPLDKLDLGSPPLITPDLIAADLQLELAAELGSDVPFFLLGGTAAGIGRGTELYPLPDAESRPGLLIRKTIL